MTTPNGSNVLFKVGDVVVGINTGNVYKVLGLGSVGLDVMVLEVNRTSSYLAAGIKTIVGLSKVKLKEAAYAETEWV